MICTNCGKPRYSKPETASLSKARREAIIAALVGSSGPLPAPDTDESHPEAPQGDPAS